MTKFVFANGTYPVRRLDMLMHADNSIDNDVVMVLGVVEGGIMTHNGFIPTKYTRSWIKVKSN